MILKPPLRHQASGCSVPHWAQITMSSTVLPLDTPLSLQPLDGRPAQALSPHWPAAGFTGICAPSAELFYCEVLFPEDCSFPWKHYKRQRTAPRYSVGAGKGHHAWHLDIQRLDPWCCFPLRISRQESALWFMSSSHTYNVAKYVVMWHGTVPGVWGQHISGIIQFKRV